MKIYNTASRVVEKFTPIKEGAVGIYACGPTVYNYAHIGNMRTYIFEDILRRVFEKLDFNVNHVMNITDVGHLQSDADSGDDKISLAASRENKSPWDIAREYETAFFRHCEALRIKRPHIVCRATEHIKEIIAMIESLVAKGYAYERKGNVYFSVSKFEKYSQFAKLRLDAQQSTDRVSEDRNKENQADFSLWFSNSKYPNQIMKWDSPWGEGFPGWHIECSAMSSKYLGEKFDIHCGGIDHIPVHHTNEIAQSDCCHGSKTVNYWMHGAFLTINSDKMSKSNNTFYTVDTIRDMGFSPLSYRYLVLTSHYRNELNFDFNLLKEAEKSYNKLQDKINEWLTCSAEEKTNDNDGVFLKQKYLDQFWHAIENDLHTPAALGIAWTVARSRKLSANHKLSLFEEFDQIFGLDLLSISERILTIEEEELLNLRNEAREKKDWVESDRIRDELLKRNIVLKDGKEGTTWSKLK